MSIVTMVLGESGTGKSASLRNMSPEETLLIQVVKKPLPFKSSEWKRFNKETAKDGNIFQTDTADQIISLMKRTKRKVIIIDDFQYVMAN